LFTGHAKGYGFVTPDEGGDDFFVPPTHIGDAVHGDTVAYYIDRRRYERHLVAKITEVIKRGKNVYVGTMTNGLVKPLEYKIPYIFYPTASSRSLFPLADGHRVTFSLKNKDIDFCVVTGIIGHINDPGMDVLSLLYEHGIPFEFPADTLKEAAKTAKRVLIKNRLDLRKTPIFTLDGEDTKDIDDAVSLEMLPNGFYKLGVHIADVAHYVPKDSALDREAKKRGNSLYLADRVIPMLPHALSNGICSLNPNQSRLCISCIMTIDINGNVINYNIAESVIRSKKRFTYERVQELIQESEPDKEEAFWLPVLLNMNRLRGILFAKRKKRGALQFDMPETKINVDSNGQPVSVDGLKYPSYTASTNRRSRKSSNG
jgi:ribonuclease R